MKRISWTVASVILVLVLAVAGCGNKASSPSNEAGGSSAGGGASASSQASGDQGAKKSYTIGFSNISVVNTWRVQMVRELESAAKRENVKLYITDAGGDVTKQISDVQDLISRGIDALLITPGSPTATNAVMKKALNSGIPVVAFNSDVEGEDNYTAFVGTDEKEFGYVISKWLLQQIGGKGNIVVLNGIAGNSISNDRFEGLQKALAELPDGGKNVKILAQYNADWAYDKGKQAMEQALAAFPTIDGVWSQGGAMAQGAMEAIQAAGRKMVPVTGEDNNGYLKLWKKLQPEGFKGVAASEPTWQSVTALETALDILNGKQVKKKTYIPVPLITDENLDAYLKPDLSDSFWANTKLSPEDIEKYYKEK
jgi:ribose transport system substrate-binding protein